MNCILLRGVFLILLSLVSMRSLGAVILQYHHVSDETPASTSISPVLFEQHLDYLSQSGYQIWPLQKLVDNLSDDVPVPDKVVVITFDDAFSSIFDNAFPSLKKRGWPFTVFVSSEPIDFKIKPYMTWQQLRELRDGGASIANHGHRHMHFVRQLPNESEDDWLTRISQDISHAQKRLTEELGNVPKLLAYPYGEYTHSVMSLVESMGYAAFGQQSGAVGKGMSLRSLPRYPMTNIYGEMSQFKTKVASLPLLIEEIEPSERVVSEGMFKDGLRIRFKGLKRPINCYLSGTGKVSLEQQGSEIYIPKLADLPIGRSRINCTAPSKELGRFYWSSYYWMKRLPSGEWYPER